MEDPEIDLNFSHGKGSISTKYLFNMDWIFPDDKILLKENNVYDDPEQPNLNSPTSKKQRGFKVSGKYLQFISSRHNFITPEKWEQLCITQGFSHALYAIRREQT